MKALILAAGFGTRLLPYTTHTPKPLFSIAGRPLIDIVIHNLQKAGCREIIINTHHLAGKIDSFITSRKYTIPVHTRYEPDILDTGGAIKNAADFWDDNPFMVINSDIFTSINLKQVYDFHLHHHHPVTLVLYDCRAFNTVAIDKNNFIVNFQNKGDTGLTALTFTGIQVLDPEILDSIPDKCSCSSIDVYRKMLADNRKIKGFIAKEQIWKDIGTPENYQETVFEIMAPNAFKQAFPENFSDDTVNVTIKKTKLKGDGSDRQWYRIKAKNSTLILADHGIRKHDAIAEVDSFIAIGRHLHDRGIPVPYIHLFDKFSGMVFLEDLGNKNLQTIVRNEKNPDKIINIYRSVIDLLVKMAISGGKGFDPSLTYQTPEYNLELILEKECRYFVDAFLKGFLGLQVSFKDLEKEFLYLAEQTLEFAVNGFMHRDLQSRNIMVKNNNYFFIDFQGGRMGPIQYDLASLLIDPYVQLPQSVCSQLLDDYREKLSVVKQFNRQQFKTGYSYCCITRNLQMLGAFGYLSRVKGKTRFQKYIPAAVKTLNQNLEIFKAPAFPVLKSIVEKIKPQ